MHEKPRIFIVDDDASARMTLEALLHPESYELIFAANGPEALARFEEVEPDVVLLDVMMPEMDGFTVCRHLKKDKRWRHIPIILVTALHSKEDIARGLDAGADEFLSKPVNGLELRARVRSMLRIKKQYDDLMVVLQLREDLAGMIVHDMRNPLTAIVGFSELLLISELPADLIRDVQHIQNQAQRLSSFINDLLMLAKMEHGNLLLNRSPVDIEPFIQQTRESHQIIAQSRRISFEIEMPAEPSRQVAFDANLVQRALDNLLSNAFKFSEVGSTVTLRVVYPAQAGVRFEILDQGPGIATEDRERIFEKFEVVALKKEGVRQVGLGLVFSKLVVDAHGGRLFIKANEPQGSVFVVELE